MNRDTMNTD